MPIRALTTFPEFADCQRVQQAVWGFEDIDVVPSHLLKALADASAPWSILLGAYEGDEMIGFAWCVHTADPRVLLFHMLAVLPTAQHQHVGRQLMHAAAEQTVARGATTLVWTFDPLESVNAHLYLHRMGAVGTAYVDAYYPSNTSALHAGGIPSDRLKMTWDCVHYLQHGTAQRRAVATDRQIVIPGNFQELKQRDIEQARTIRQNTRDAFHQHLTQDGCVAVDYVYDAAAQCGRYYFADKRCFAASISFRKCP